MRSDRCNRWVHHHLPLLAVLLSLMFTVAQVMMTDSIGLAIIHLMTGMHDLAAAFVASGDLAMVRHVYLRCIAAVDELPVVASHGLLTEITFPRKLLMQLGYPG